MISENRMVEYSSNKSLAREEKMIEVTITEIQDVNRSYAHVIATGRNKNSFKKAMLAAKREFSRLDAGGSPVLKLTTIRKNGKIIMDTWN